MDLAVLDVKRPLSNNKFCIQQRRRSQQQQQQQQEQQQQRQPQLAVQSDPFDLYDQMSFVFITLAIFQSHFLSFNSYNC